MSIQKLRLPNKQQRGEVDEWALTLEELFVVKRDRKKGFSDNDLHRRTTKTVALR